MKLSSLFSFAIFAVASSLSVSSFAADPAHLVKARAFVDNIKPENNYYGDSPVVFIAGNATTQYQAQVRCNQFLNEDLKASYGWNLYTRFGSSSPSAEKWFDIINAQKNVTKISGIASVVPGDILASKYLDGTTTAKGHVMIVNLAPVKVATAYDPIVPGTTQFFVQILDSSSSFHGSTDIRGTNGDTGIGKGLIRLYADTKGNVVGWTWSDSKYSDYQSATTRPIVVGRVKM